MPIPAAIITGAKIAAPYVASAGINWLMNRITGSPQRKGYEQFIGQQSPVLEQLRQQALGKPGTASKFLESRLQQAARQSRQAEAATSTRQGLGTQSAIARQRQIGVQTEQTLADLLGQLQLGSQAQYGQLMGQVGEMKAGMATAEMAERKRAEEGIGRQIERLFRAYNEAVVNKGKPRDSWYENLLKQLDELARPLSETYNKFRQQQPLVTTDTYGIQDYSPLRWGR